jgi:putative membrane-bound dehydrogenase-like protein
MEQTRMGQRIGSVVAVCMALVAAAPAHSQEIPPDQRTRKESGAPLPLADAARTMTLPPGFTATLFAGEPDVHQPISFCIDHRGRLWVAENDAFPKPQTPGTDRVVILEDTDGDGRHDKRTVFAEGLNYVTSVLSGSNGVYVIDCPRLLFFPIKPGDDKPAGPPIVLLDGLSPKGVHNLPNSMTWGPDGWLYGCNGTIFDVEIGPPGAPASDRVKMNRGVWRYHPARKTFERFAEGTANPWGLDYDERGQLFMTNNVVAHLWHVVQGGKFPRTWGSDSNKHAYELIPTIADHLHYAGADWKESRGGTGTHGTAGGGHSHAGCTLYLGDSFPPEYRNAVLACNTHGHRINHDTLERAGSSFVAKHRPDFMTANDPWFKGVSVQYGPHGDLFVIDWSDTGECHDYDATDRKHGRVYRIAYQGTKRPPVDLEKEPPARLVEMQTWTNEWYVRHARTVLRDRGGLDAATRAALMKLFRDAPNPLHRLRAMWTLHQCAALDRGWLFKATADPDEHVRAWAIQLLTEDPTPSEDDARTYDRLAELAAEDPSPVVRLYLASAMQRAPVDRRRPILEPLIARADDALDHNLPLMYWYALEPVVASDRKSAATLLSKTKIPKVRELIVRRMAAK